MKHLIFSVLLLLISSQGVATSSSFDFSKINQAILMLFQPLVDEDQDITNMTLKFDEEYTNLDEDRARLNAVIGVTHSRWIDTPSTMFLDLESSITNNDSRGVLNVGGKLGFETATLELVRYLFVQEDLVEELCVTGAENDNWWEKRLRKVWCQFVESGSEIESVDEFGLSLANAVVQSKKIAKKMVGDAEQSTKDEGAELLELLTSFVITAGDNELVISLKNAVTIYESDSSDLNVVLSQFEGRMTATNISVSGSFAVETDGESLEEMSAGYRRLLTEILVGLQSQDEQVLEQFRFLARLYISIAKSLIID
jgi:hypothetical protein